MPDDLFNLILQTATFNGEACYNNAEEMEKDYKINQFVSLNPTEITSSGVYGLSIWKKWCGGAKWQ